MPVVQGQDGSGAVTLDKYDVGCHGHADCLVTVIGDDLAGLLHIAETEAGQQVIGLPGNRLTAGEEGAAWPGPDITHRLANGLADNLGLGNSLLGCRALNGESEVGGQIQGGPFHGNNGSPGTGGAFRSRWTSGSGWLRWLRHCSNMVA